MPQGGHLYFEYSCLHCRTSFLVDCDPLPENDNDEMEVIIHHVDERGWQWLCCPNCDNTFTLHDHVMRDGRHTKCGQRLRILGDFA